MTQKKESKEKKIVFSAEVDDQITGFALVLALVVTGLILQFDSSYFGNAIITKVIQWIFIVIGALGMAVEIGKIKSSVTGIDNLLIGIIILAGWYALYRAFNQWYTNIIAFILLFFGAYGAFLGSLQMVYSLSHREIKEKTEEAKRQEKGDIILLITKLLGVVLVVMQIIKAVMEISKV